MSKHHPNGPIVFGRGNDDDHKYVVFQKPSEQQIQLLAQSNDTISSVPGLSRLRIIPW